MSYAHIYTPPKSAMQSGKAKTGYWMLEYDNCDERCYDPIMGWTGSTSTLNQVCLKFDTLEEAISFAKSIGLNPIVESPGLRQKNQKRTTYADNFRFRKP